MNVNIPSDPRALVRLVWSWITWAAGLAITAMIVVHVAGRYGYSVPYIPNGEAMQLAALAVAWWAAPKG